jgi:hypothetical protein
MKKLYTCVIFLIAILALSNCRKPFEPTPIQNVDNLLVVEGFINSSSNAPTTITVSRTRSLADTVRFLPEPNALVIVEGETGDRHMLNNMGNGMHQADQLTLIPGSRYRVDIRTNEGKQYLSQFVEVKQTPPIDSLTWLQEDGLTIFANTHDPANNTRYYRWDFVETWEYHSVHPGFLGFRDGQIFFRDSTNLWDKCWSTENSANITVGSSARLAEDVISRQPVHFIDSGSIKLNVRYSILVRQYALTREAFEFWEILKGNTEQLGELFDAQPSQLFGNIYCASDPNEPVVGFISASTVQEKRLFIKNNELNDWYGLGSGGACDIKFINPAQAPIYLSDFTYSPVYFMTGAGLAIAPTPCVDCTKKGGVTQQPAFW